MGGRDGCGEARISARSWHVAPQASRISVACRTLVRVRVSRADGHEPVRLGNVCWLAGYRMSRCCKQPWDALLLAQFAEPGPLIAGAKAVGDPIAVLPTLYHLVWTGRFHTDLSVRLDALSGVSCG
ncbi:hypothetical protein [Streptomyces sp. NPDC001165]|uniref:hypothetical protein n=1 Tax=Streptomyces sp. NPDC001165 TaxID=3364546 RepID=UPI0036857182